MTITHSPVAWVLGLVVLQRLLELALASRNTLNLLQRGGREVGRNHYPMFILLHGSWLIAIALLTPMTTEPYWPLIWIFILLQMLRLWIIAMLGPYWTTRVITLDKAPLVRTGPFKYLRHPNYWVVSGEIAVLPLAFGQWEIAVVWSSLNALLLRHRIGVETQALAPRQRHKFDG